MGIVELVTEIGDENIRAQFLDQCAINLDWSKKKGTKITFGTEVGINPTTGTDKLGIVIWLDREAVKAVIAKEKAQG